jgi:hypothetical protein
MQKYEKDVQIAGRRPAVGASVTVTIFGTTDLATLYSDNGVTPKANPTTTDDTGTFFFYAADGRYDIEIVGTGFDPRTISDVLLEDPVDGSAALAASGGSALVGFTQSGTGAVARTAQAKMREIVNVTDFYANGASGAAVDMTGTIDSSGGMAAALTYVKANGLTLWIPPGTVRAKNLRMEGGAQPWALVGAGKDLTTIEHSDGDGTLLIGNAGSSVPYTLADFTVDCMDSVYNNPGANNAISYADTTGVMIYRVRVQDYANNGILGFASVANTFGYCEAHDCEAIGNGAGTNNGMLYSDMPGCKWVRCRGYNVLGSPGYAHLQQRHRLRK